MTEHAPTTTVKEFYEQQGPVPGLISADHEWQAIGSSWWRNQPDSGARWVIPGLWRWGHRPLLTGQPKTGKTTVVVDLAASLLIPGRRFLNHFEPSGMTPDAHSRGIVLINAETPSEALVAELLAAIGENTNARELLDVYHLEQLGGAATFDLTEPGLFDQWAHNLTSCWTCDRTDDVTPSVVIVDGLTAIVLAAAKGVDYYGLWYAKFRLLMTELRVPNALVVGHSTLTGTHSMGGTEALAGPDGLWTYASDSVDDPRSPRRFSAMPRMGGEVVTPLRVIRNDDGRLEVPRYDSAEGGGAAMAKVEQWANEGDADERVRMKLRESGASGLRKTHITGSGRLAYESRAALERLVARGEVTERPEGQGSRYWLTEMVRS